jgi:adenylate kinase
MRVLLVAGPGAGKGTQAEKLAAHYGVAHLSSGELLRQAVKDGTNIGKQASDDLQHGDLVPDELILTMLAEPIIQASRNGGYVLDGFPRNLRQAEAAYELTKQVGGIELEAVIHLEVAREELRRRLLARAGHEGRSDDAADVVTHRFEVYTVETEPLLTFYRARHLVLEINGEQDEEQVFADIVRSYERHLAAGRR